MGSDALIAIISALISLGLGSYGLYRGTKSDKVAEQSGLGARETAFSGRVLEDNRILRERIQELEAISSPKKLKKRVTEIAKEVNGK